MAARSKILRLKERVVNWLVRNVTIEKLRVRKLKIGNNTVVIAPDYIDLPGLSADPTLSAGRIWFRSDLSKLRWSPDGSTVSDIGGYFNLSQLTELTWDVWPTVDDIAAEMETRDVSECVELLKNINPNFAVSIIKSPNLSADKAQLILRNLPLNKLMEIITCDAMSAQISSNTTITGINRYKDLIINSGVTLSIDGQPGIIIAERIINKGTIAKIPTGGAGGNTEYPPGRGGKGGGGLYIFAKEITNSGIIRANGANGETGDASNADGFAYSGGNGIYGIISGDSIGSGGNGGSFDPDYVGKGIVGGGGGGIGDDFYGGDGGDATIEIYGSEDNLYAKFKNALIDWWLQNVINKTPSVVEDFPSYYGAGGGGGIDCSNNCDAGGGGGSGGELIILVSNLDNTGIIQANGGNGGDGGNAGTFDSGGGGGGGGIVYVFYENATNVGTLEANGGSAGACDPSIHDYGAVAQPGTAGTARAIQISI